ncbi:MAG: Na/Pi symporter [Lentimicrobiaceae bacterium]|nr:Na/Pi symporter [Lentimicrobiaceae bacterium]
MTLRIDLLGNLLSVMGSLALFLLGMKLMSEALQRIMGGRLRQLFTNGPTTRFNDVASGALVTALTQSSSAVILLIISFISAGLIPLMQGLSVMIGANIGTTITGWIIALLGFNSRFLTYLLPLMGISLPLLFIPGSRYRSYGEFLIGFSMLFLGVYFLTWSLSANAPLNDWIIQYTHEIFTWRQLLLFTLAGIIISIVLPSSNATLALIFVLCYKGYLPLEYSAALVAGQNFGTTVWIMLAAYHANAASRRIAAGHWWFNLTGLILSLILFYPLLWVSSETALLITHSTTLTVATSPIALAAFHTLFNLIPAMVIIPAMPAFRWLIHQFIPYRPGENKTLQLRYFKSRFIVSNEVNLIQAAEEIYLFGKHVELMFSLIPKYLTEKHKDKFEKIQKRLFRLEDRADERERLIENFITHIAENSLTEANARRIRSMLKIINNLESIADQCMQMERTIRRKNEANAWFTPEMRENVFSMFNIVQHALEVMNNNLSNEYRPGILLEATQLELQINEMRNRMLDENMKRFNQGDFAYSHLKFFSDLMNECEKLADHVINVNQAIASNIRK